MKLNYALSLAESFCQLFIVCQVYKDLVAKNTSVGYCVFKNCKPRIRKEYVCKTFTGLIVGGKAASPKEFPHMAGEFKSQKRRQQFHVSS